MSEDTFSVGPVLTGTAAAVGTIDVATFNRIALLMTFSASTETVSITASVDGTNYGAAKLRPIDLATGTVTASSDVKAGFYALDVETFQSIKFTKSATTETLTIRSGLGR